jgi:hypothetical protein
MLHAATALAYPEGAPWGAANPAAAENCASCHFDYDAVLDSPGLTIRGLPGTATPGETYTLVIRCELPGAVTAGFQLVAIGGDDAGVFSTDSEHVELAGAAIRSTMPATVDGAIEWLVQWTAPEREAPVRIFLAVMATNDDGSPFGDTAHFRTFDVAM